MSQRQAQIERCTAETDIKVKFTIDGTGCASINTGIAFMDHMLTLFSKHGLFDLEVSCKGDLEVDCHHTMEDLGLVLGQAINRAVGDKKGIRRYGSMLLPMDETLAQVALDLSGRPYLVYKVAPQVSYIKDLEVSLFREFFVALINQAGMNLHIHMLENGEVHHIFEAIFKAFAKALDQATSLDPRLGDKLMTTKGRI